MFNRQHLPAAGTSQFPGPWFKQILQANKVALGDGIQHRIMPTPHPKATGSSKVKMRIEDRSGLVEVRHSPRKRPGETEAEVQEALTAPSKVGTDFDDRVAFLSSLWKNSKYQEAIRLTSEWPVSRSSAYLVSACLDFSVEFQLAMAKDRRDTEVGKLGI
jgi:hypothetical protein